MMSINKYFVHTIDILTSGITFCKREKQKTRFYLQEISL
nr:unnamed protein product [Callosobruchus analis]